jgi:undecaprenyl diphosphate synthase
MDKRVPEHVAIIMDGNRRWAKKRSLDPLEGHRRGVDTLIKAVEYAAEKKVRFLTVYALSTENYRNRSKKEIVGLLKLMKEGISIHIPRLKKEGVRLGIFGDINSFGIATKLAIKKAQKELSDGKGPVLNLAVNYGGRAEVLRAARKLSEKNPQFTEKGFERELYSAGIPDPDLIIRTGGHRRLSNFLIWQSAYSELYFTDTLWPDFDEEEFQKALSEYEIRVRNFGR